MVLSASHSHGLALGSGCNLEELLAAKNQLALMTLKCYMASSCPVQRAVLSWTVIQTLNCWHETQPSPAALAGMRSQTSCKTWFADWGIAGQNEQHSPAKGRWSLEVIMTIKGLVAPELGSALQN